MNEKPNYANGENHPERIREQLRSLGYLQNPLEKFFAGNITSKTSVLKTNLIVGLKVGVVGGTLLGLLILIGFIVLQPALLRDPADIIILGLYLALIYVVIACSLGIVGGIILTVILKATRKSLLRTKLAAIRGGMLVSVVSLVYLTFWWNRFGGGQRVGGILSPWGLLVVAVIILAAAALGRLASFAAEIILFRLSGENGLVKPTPKKVWSAALGVVLALALFYACLGVSTLRSSAHLEQPPSAFEPRQTGIRVLLLGIDGLTDEMLTYMLAKDKLPTFKRLIEQGESRPMNNLGEDSIPAIWTCVATGRPPEAHGILSIETSQIVGIRTQLKVRRSDVGFYEVWHGILPALGLARRVPVSQTESRAKAVWEILSEKGYRAAAVNWWASWPAVSLTDGAVVTDRAFPMLQMGLSGKLDLHDDACQNATYPAELLPTLNINLQQTRREIENLLPTLAKAELMDRFHVSVACQLAKNLSLDFLAVYLPGLDIFEHALFQDNRDASAAELAGHLESVQEYYQFLDEAVNSVVNSFGSPALIVLVTDPGMTDRDGTKARNQRGILLVSGTGAISEANSNSESRTASTIMDVTPTILSAMGFPVSEEMPGRVLAEALEPSILRANPVKKIASFGPRRTTSVSSAASQREIDEQLIENLKSLGYL